MAKKQRSMTNPEPRETGRFPRVSQPAGTPRSRTPRAAAALGRLPQSEIEAKKLDSILARLRAIDQRNRAKDAQPVLVPRASADVPAEIATYTSLVLTSTEGQAQASGGTAPIGVLDPAEVAGKYFERPAVGVRFTYEQYWYLSGLALGNLLSSVTLAPGEACRMAASSWQGTTSASGADTASQEDAASSDQQAVREVAESQRATASEVQYGSSRVESDSTAVEAGGLAGVFVASGGSNSTTCTTATVCGGKRDIAASATQSVHGTTVAHASAKRSSRAATVREVSEAESNTGTTRIIANYNHQHAMTMLYFEVIEDHTIVTRIVRAERILFVPMKVLNFDSADGPGIISRHRVTLAAAASCAGWPRLAQSVQSFGRTEDRNLDLKTLTAEQSALVEQLKTKNAEIDALAQQREDAVRKVHEAIERQLSSLGPLVESTIRKVGAEAFIESQLKPQLDALTAPLNKQTQAKKADRIRIQSDLDAKSKELDDKTAAYQRADKDVLAQLQDHALYYSQAVWLTLDTSSVSLLLAGKAYTHAGVPGESAAPEPLDGSVDPRPVGVYNNYLVLRWNHARAEDDEAFSNQHSASEVRSRVAMPTGAVFAEAVLAESNCAEKLDSTRFWDWQKSPPPLQPPQISAVSMGSRYHDVNTTPTPVGASAAVLPQMMAMPDFAGTTGILNAVSNGNLFRDMSGINVAGELAKQAVASSTAGAQHAADTALSAMDKILEAGKAATQSFSEAMKGAGQSGPGLDPSQLSGDASEAEAAADAGGAGELAEVTEIIGELGPAAALL